jgi:hypothetical protein
MALATPSNITISRLYRVFGENQKITTVDGPREFGPRTFQVFGNISWTNTETTQHAVILTVAGRETLLTSGANEIKDVLFAGYTAPNLEARDVVVTVRLQSNTETSDTASSTFSVAGGQSAAFTGQLSVSGNNILLPEWSGAINGRRQQIQYQLGQFITRRNIESSDTEAPLGGLIQNQTYRARYNLLTGVSAATGSYRISLSVATIFGGINTINNTQTVRFYRSDLERITADLFFIAPEPVVLFTATSANTRALVNAPFRFKLEANYRATWEITGGNPGGFGIEYFPENFGTAVGPDEAFLVGTPTSVGSFAINLTATRADAAQTTSATVNLTVVEALPRTVITTNAAIARDGVSTTTTDTVNISFRSTPSPATFNASGLPPGVTIDAEGTISGRPTRRGTFFASITAKAEDFDTSLPTTIRFVVADGTGTVFSSNAERRSPWLLAQWELTDLHILARNRDVESTLFDNGALRLKLGDAINFAVFFIDSSDEVFALDPSQLRLTIRRADNLDDLIIFKSSTPPESDVEEDQTYYLMPVTTGNREREVALEWAEDNGKNEPLPCVADLDWTKDGKVYSSRTFPVLLELDVTRP